MPEGGDKVLRQPRSLDESAEEGMVAGVKLVLFLDRVSWNCSLLFSDDFNESEYLQSILMTFPTVAVLVYHT